MKIDTDTLTAIISRTCEKHVICSDCPFHDFAEDIIQYDVNCAEVVDYLVATIIEEGLV